MFSFDHVHLWAPDQGEACAWYVRHLGAVPGAQPDRVLIGDERWLIFFKGAAEDSRDSVLDRIGFSVERVDGVAADIASAGGSVIAAPHDAGPFRTAIVADPWGSRLMLVDDPAVRGFHHMHLSVSQPARTLAWFAQMFGGERASLAGRFDGIRYGSAWLLSDAGAGQPSAGRAIDHLAWRAPHLDTAAAALRAQGIPFTMEPKDFNPATRISFVEGPEGIRLEVLERRQT